MIEAAKRIRHFTLVVAVLFFAVPFSLLQAQGIDVSLPDVSGDPGQTVTIPISTGDITGEEIISYGFDIVYDEDVINITGIDKSGTLSDGMSVLANTNKTDTVTVGAASGSAIEGSGTLLKLTAEFVALGSSDLTFLEFEYNSSDGSYPPVNLTNGSATVGDLDTVSVEGPSAVVKSGSTGLVPVSVSDVTGLDVQAYGFTVTYDTSVIEITGTDIAGTLSSNMTGDINADVPGEVRVSYAATEALSGDGTLLNLEVMAKSGGTSPIEFSEFTFNEGQPLASTVAGSVEVNAPPVNFNTLVPADGDTVNTSGGATLEWMSSSDPEGEGLDYTVTILGNDTSFTTTDTTATLSEEYLHSYLDGSAYATVEWYVEASDSYFSTSTDTMSYVLERMMAPAPFSIIGPVDMDLVVRSLTEEYTASWNSTVDPNADPVTYTMGFVGVDTSLSAGSDTSLTLTGQQLLDQFVAPDQHSAEISWYVEASDGMAVTMSDTGTFSLWDVTEAFDIAAARIDENDDFIPDMLGGYARITGTVTTGNYASEGSMQYFMQDGTAGISLFSSGFSESLSEGDEVEVVGQIDQFNGLTEIIPESAEDIDVLSSGNDVTPNEVALTDIGEDLEGQLVEISWISVPTDNWPSAGSDQNITVTDTLGNELTMRLDQDTEIPGSSAPEPGLNRIVGPVGQFTSASPPSDGYQILPWAREDIVHIEGTAVETPENLPDEYALNQNYPNPFNPTTTIQFQLPEQSDVSVTVYNMAGQQVTSLVNTSMDAGYHQVTWNGTNDAGVQMSSGMYIYRIRAEDFTDSKKMILMR